MTRCWRFRRVAISLAVLAGLSVWLAHGGGFNLLELCAVLDPAGKRGWLPTCNVVAADRALSGLLWLLAILVAIGALGGFVLIYDKLSNNAGLLKGHVHDFYRPRVPGAVVDAADAALDLEALKRLAAEEALTPESRDRLERLQGQLFDLVMDKIAVRHGLDAAEPDLKAEAAAREAVRTVVEMGDPAERGALRMIADGDIADGLDALAEIAQTSTITSAGLWRRIGQIAYPVDTNRALDAYERVVAMDNSDPWDAIYLCRLYVQSGALDPARQTAERALNRLAPEEVRDRKVLLDEMGDILVAQGDLDAALTRYRAALEIAKGLVANDPGNAEWRRDLWVSHIKVGDGHLAQGDLDDALTRYQASLAIAEGLARDDPGDAVLRRDFSASHIKVGDVHRARGDLDASLTRYRASLAIREGLARDDPGNAAWRRDLAVSHWKLAESGDDPHHHWAEVVRILEALAADGRLAPPDRGWLDTARQQLAGLD
jgi:tetratricopeptide (TPR) repeat protein